MKKGLFLLFVCLLPALSWGQLFQNMFRFNCDASIEVMPNFPAGLYARVPLTRSVLEAVFDSLYDRVNCTCGVTKDEFRLFYDPFSILLDWHKDTPAAVNQCIKDNFPRNFRDIGFFRLPDMPSTCSWDTYKNDGTCFFKQPFPLINATLEIGISKCPNAWFPAVSVTCSGIACANLLKPCTGNSECGGAPLTCYDLEAKFPSGTSRVDVDNIIYDMFAELGIYDNKTDVTPGCYQNRGNAPRSSTNDIAYSLLTWVRKGVFSSNGEAPYFKFCGIGQVVDLDLLFNDGSQFKFPDNTFLTSLNPSTTDGVSSSHQACFFNEPRALRSKDYFNHVGGQDGIVTSTEYFLADVEASKCNRNYFSQTEIPPKTVFSCSKQININYVAPNSPECDAAQNSNSGSGNGQSSIRDNINEFRNHYKQAFKGKNSQNNNCNPQFSCVSQDIQIDTTDITSMGSVLKAYVGSLDVNQDGYLDNFEQNSPFSNSMTEFVWVYYGFVQSVMESYSKTDFDSSLSFITNVLNDYFTKMSVSVIDDTQRKILFSYVHWIQDTYQNCGFGTYCPTSEISASNCVAGSASFFSNAYYYLDSNLDGLVSPAEIETIYGQENQQGFQQATLLYNFGPKNSNLTQQNLTEFGNTFFNDYFLYGKSSSNITVTNLSKLQLLSNLANGWYNLGTSGFTLPMSVTDFISNVTSKLTKEFTDHDLSSRPNNNNGVDLNGYLSDNELNSLKNSYNVNPSNDLFLHYIHDVLFGYPPMSNSISSYNAAADYLTSYITDQTRKVDNNNDQHISMSESWAINIQSHRNVIQLTLFMKNSGITWDQLHDTYGSFDKFTNSSTLAINLPNLLPWDGKNSNGVPVQSITSVLTPFTRVADKFNILQFTCSHQLLFENQNTGIIFKNLPLVTSYFSKLVFDLVACRSNPVADKVEEFLMRYGPWSPFFWLYLLDKNAANYPLPKETDWMHNFFKPDHPESTRIANLPSSCNFQRYLTEGVCEFDFDGFKEILTLDISIRFTAQRCSSNTFFSSYKVECVGKDCPLMTGLAACDTTPQCFGTTKCQAGVEFFSNLMGVVRTYVDKPTQAPTQPPTQPPPPDFDCRNGSVCQNGANCNTNTGLCDCSQNTAGFDCSQILPPSNNGGNNNIGEVFRVLSNVTFIGDVVLRTDWLEIFFSKDMNGPLCSQPDAFNSDIMDVFGKSTDKQCYGPTRWQKNLHYILMRIFGAPVQPTGVNSILNYCLIDPAVLIGADFEGWVKSLISITQSTVTLGPSFKAVVAPPTQPPTSGPTNAPTSGPTNAPTSGPTTAPTDAPVPLPDCRCRSNCGNLDASNCAACYLGGGQVLSSAPSSCFCKSTGEFIASSKLATYDFSTKPSLCASPLAICSSCSGCHDNCLTCFGTGANQCLSCLDPNKVIVYSQSEQGYLTSGSCFAKCSSDQVLDSNGVCKGPDCSSLNNCTSTTRGICLYSTFSQQSYCLCNQGYYGKDCSQTPDCTLFNNCNNHGKCDYSLFYRDSRCTCNPGWSGEACDEPTVDFYPNYGSELGGVLVNISATAFESQVNCRFGSVVVPAVVSGDLSFATCIAPPSPISRVPVSFSISFGSNPTKFTSSKQPFYYYDSSSITPRDSDNLENSFLWEAGKTKTFYYNKDESSSSTVVVKLLAWQWDQFGGSEPSLITINSNLFSGSKTGSVEVTLPSDITFNWGKAVYILSIQASDRHFNYYVIPHGSTEDYATHCSNWGTAEAKLAKDFINELPGCPNSLFNFDFRYGSQPYCNRNNGMSPSNCPWNTGALECVQLNVPSPTHFGGRVCCYGQGGNLIDDKAIGGGNVARYGVSSISAIQSLKNFVADVLPYLICCKKSSSSATTCPTFSQYRPTSGGIPWQPPAGGRGFGDPHLITLDGGFWSFNALGEFVLLEHTDVNFVIQGRFEKVATAKATILTALAVKDGSSTVSAYSDENGKITFFTGDTMVSKVIHDGDNYQSPDGKIFIFGRTGGTFDILLPSGVTVQITPEIGSLASFFVLPQSFFGKTRGLLGTWNNNKLDEFTLRNGKVLASDSKEDYLFSNFGLTYAVSSFETLFLYPSGKTFDDYNKLDFVPDFIVPTFSSPQFEAQAQAACAGALSVDACLYDVSQTNNLQSAQSSLKAATVFNNFRASTNLSPVVNTFPTTLSGHLNEVVVVTFNVTDPEGKTITPSLVSGPSGKFGSNTFTFTINANVYLSASVPDLKIAFTDDKGASTLATAKVSVSHYDCTNLDGVVSEVNLELASNCISSTECSDDCKSSIKRFVALTCLDKVKEKVSTLESKQEQCCNNADITCPAKTGKSNLTGGQIAGIVIGAIAGVFLIAGAIAFGVYYANKSKKSNEHEMK